MTLNPYERRALAVRLRDGEKLTFTAIGARLGVSVTRARDIVEAGRREQRLGLRRRSDTRCGECARYAASSWNEAKGRCTYPLPPSPKGAPNWLKTLESMGGPVNVTSGSNCPAFKEPRTNA